MRLTKQTSDAVKILIFCHNNGEELIKVADMSKELGLRKQMALKICTLLRQEGFLDTVRGPKGGIRLAKAAHNSTLGEIVRSVESSSRSDDSGELAHLDDCFDEAMNAFFMVLDGHSLKEIAEAKSQALEKVPPKKAPTRKSRSRKAKTARKSRPNPDACTAP